MKQAYGIFQKEVYEHAPDYEPQTITTDGWDATRSVWETLFPTIVWILCFLHEVIKVRDGCRSKRSLRHTLTDKLWNIYHAPTKRQFAQRLRRFLEWTTTNLASQLHRPTATTTARQVPIFSESF